MSNLQAKGARSASTVAGAHSTLPTRSRRTTESGAPPLRKNYSAFFASTHEPALAFEPTVDSSILASFHGDAQVQSQTDLFVVRRPVYTEKELNERFEIPQTEFSFADCVSKLRCSKKCAKSIALSYLPFVDTVKRYDVKKMLLVDTLCGFTIGLVNIAQGLTHGLLANIYPIIGLYSSFFPILLYSVFGTSRILAYGTVSITSIIVGNSVQEIADGLLRRPDGNGTAAVSNDEVLKVNSDIAICITFVSGLIQMVAGILHLGLVTVYFSDAMVAGFTTATMIHVITSQAKNVLGLQFPKATGLGNVIITWIRIFENIGKTNLATLVISLIAAAFLLLFKYLINPFVIKKIYAPIPAEAIVVIVGTVLSQVMGFSKNYGVAVVGQMSNGLPVPSVPNVSLLDDVIVASITCAIINYAVSVSLAQVLAKKNNEEVDANQECFAYGACNFASSFFMCMPTGASVSRSYIQDSMQCKSQLAGIVQSIIMLVVLLWLSSFFSTLPQCTLAVIIIVALTAIGEHFKQAWNLWIVARLDCIIWIVSFLSTAALDIQPGLIISIIFSCFMVVVRGQLVHSVVLGNIYGTDLYRDVATYKRVKEIEGVKIFRFEGSLHFACVNIFRSALYRKTGINPRQIGAEQQGETVPLLSGTGMRTDSNSSVNASAIRFVIIDLSACSFVDYGGLRVLMQVSEEYRAIGISVVLASCPRKVRRSLIAAGFFSETEPGLEYVSVHDAVTYAKSALRMESSNKSVYPFNPSAPLP